MNALTRSSIARGSMRSADGWSSASAREEVHAVGGEPEALALAQAGAGGETVMAQKRSGTPLAVASTTSDVSGRWVTVGRPVGGTERVLTRKHALTWPFVGG